MPVYVPENPAKIQLFLSNYFMETFFHAFLEKKPFVMPLYAAELNNKIAPFNTDTFECVFPFMTARFGRNVSTDLMLKARRIYDVETINEGT